MEEIDFTKRSMETHNAIAAITPEQVTSFIGQAVEAVYETPINALRQYLSRELCGLSLDSKGEDFTRLRDRIAIAKRIVAEMQARADDAFVEWLTEHGDYQEGDMRYYAGTERVTKCVNARATLERLLNATGGDLDKLADTLASGAFKPGACKQALPAEDYDASFITEERASVKEGKPSRKVIAVNPKFIK